METLLPDIFNGFETGEEFRSAKKYGSGHIHETFLVKTSYKKEGGYILQRLNNHVFKNIREMQENIARVTTHIRMKLNEEGLTDIQRRCIELINTKDGSSYLIDNKGYFWRMMRYIPETVSYDLVENKKIAREAGKAIGKFQNMLADLPAPPLHDTIPWFHDVGRRLEAFHKVLRSDPVGKAASVKDETGFVLAREEKMKAFLQLCTDGKLPLRITHNDTKINNILFGTDGRALLMIDLDTVMPGYVHYDFGDAIRTAISTSEEDEPDLNKVGVDMSRFKSFTDGYLSQIAKTLTRTEIETLAFSPILITFIMGLRFLTDYIDGDNYFRIEDSEHNLRRAKNQFRLVEVLEENYNEMDRLVRLMAGLSYD